MNCEQRIVALEARVAKLEELLTPAGHLGVTLVGKSSFPALKRACDTATAALAAQEHAAAKAVYIENVRLRNHIANLQSELDEIYQTAGKALGYPFLCDDQTNFPGTTEKEGVLCGEHTAVTVVAELARKYEERNLLIDDLAAKNTALHREIEALKGNKTCTKTTKSD